MAAEFNCDETRPEYQSLGGELKGVTSLVIHATTAQPELGERAARLEARRFDIMMAARDTGHLACLTSLQCRKPELAAA